MDTVHNLRNEIISAVPCLLGHRPHEAVVVLGIRDNVLASAADTAILIAAAWDPSIAQHAMACIHAAPEPRSHLDLWTWVTRHASGPELAAPAVLAACAAHLCASDDTAVAFARAAMGAAVGWPSALLTNRILRYFTEATTPPRED